MDQILRDIRYSARKLLRTPGFTTVVVATLALAIGATTAVFSIVDGILLKSLPFTSPDRIVQVSSVGKSGMQSMSYLDYSDYRARSHSFAAMAEIANTGPANLTSAGATPLRLSTLRVGASFFEILGLHAIAGRLFVSGDDAQNAAMTVVLSEGLWRSRFGADPGVVGKVIDLDGTPTTVIGVAPKTATWPPNADAWVPLIPSSDDVDPNNRGAHYLNGVARLAPGATVQGAAHELADIASQLAHEHPQMNTGFSAAARPLQEAIVGRVQRPLYVLLGCVGFVLLIACANIANLLLVRASTRETEMAVRTAMGASRAVLVRQLVIESLLLGLVGAAAGVLLAAWAVHSVVAFGPKGLPRLGDVTIDATILGFAIAIAAAAALLFGLAPALHAARANVSQMLREGSRGGSRAGVHRTRSALVVAEMALAVVLLVGAGLFMRSLVELTRVKLGYEPEHVVSMNVSLPGKKYPWDAEQNGFFDRVIAGVRAIPGVQDAAIAFGRPLQQAGMRLVFEVVGWAPSTPENRHVADIRAVSPGFFSTLRIPLIAGRGVLPSDDDRSTPVVVVSQTFVKTYFPNENPIGKRLTFGYGRQRSADPKDTLNAGGTIVGVVGDIKAVDPSQPALSTVYLPLAQFPMNVVSILARSSGPEGPAIAGMRNAIASVDGTMPIYGVLTMEAAVSESIAQPKFYTMLLSGFAAIALIIAALGIYGVISYAVTQRTREMGIRLALGATQQSLVQMVVGEGLVTATIGLALGLGGAFELAKVVGKLLFETPARDPATFGLVAVVLVGVAAIASYVPARRAAKVDPVSAIRAE